MPNAGVAQLVEQLICNHQVRGSSPCSSTITIEKCPRCGFELPEGRFCPICRVKMKCSSGGTVDTLVLGTSAVRRESSNLSSSTNTLTHRETDG